MSMSTLVPTLNLENSARPPIHILMRTLSTESQVTIRKLVSTLKSPVDAPAAFAVISGAATAINAYGETLSKPTQLFKEIKMAIGNLANECAHNRPTWDLSTSSDSPLRRRLTRNPAWGLLLELSKAITSSELLVTIGVELAYGMAAGKPFPDGHAKNLRRSLPPTPPFIHAPVTDKNGEQAWLPHFRKTSQAARKLFDGTGTPSDDDKEKSFNQAAIAELRGTSLFPSPRHRQGILDHTHQSPALLVKSAAALRTSVLEGSDDSALAILAFLCGLSLRTTHRMPLAGFEDEWVMELDVEAGILRTDLAPVFTKSARPKIPESHRPAGRVMAKPLPSFLSDALLERLNEHPGARCVVDLLPNATCDGNRLTLPDESFGLEPSIARFTRSAAGFALSLGIDRLAAAAVANDFGVIPSSKLYYCRLERDEIWKAATIFYNELDWGAPTDFVNGIAFGSRVVPTRAALCNWYSCTQADLDRLYPGRHCGLDRLIAFHNRFAEACAAMATFNLASRSVAHIRFSAQSLAAGNRYMLLFDKRVGHLPRALPVPINEFLATQNKLWVAHCRGLYKRLSKLDVHSESELSVLQHLDDIAKAKRVDMFFKLNTRLKPQPLSSEKIVRASPAEFRFDPDFGRHFWQSELRSAGIDSSTIDLLVRHQVVGIGGHRSTADRSVEESFISIASAQVMVLFGLGFRPFQGLAKK